MSNPTVLNKDGISLEDVRSILGQANANHPKGQFADARTSWEIDSNDKLYKAADYLPLMSLRTAARSQGSATSARFGRGTGRARRGSDERAACRVVDRDHRAWRQRIDTVDGIRAALHDFARSFLQGSIFAPPSIGRTIGASVHDMERTLLIAIGLVVLVVFAFLRNGWATVIPGIAVPLSLPEPSARCGSSVTALDNLSLMALTISTGFVIDDAIVVLENITRHIEEGRTALEAALIGSREIGFTVLAMSLSLVAVFIPLLLMGGLVGRLFASLR